MLIIKTIIRLRSTLDKARAKGQTIGFVPTMGSFHEGHLSLMRQAKKDNDLCVVSIYVNPTQFGPKEDFKKYPRDLRRDSSMILKENIDILFVPSDNEIYSDRYLTYIDVEKISQPLCGHFRPGHFRGVATVVAKLLNIVQPHVMYLGQKDAQQVAVLRTMIQDLNFPVKVEVVATSREQDGLAMSSRNKYLSPKDRQESVVLYKALSSAKAMVESGTSSPAKVKATIKSLIKKESSGKIQYVECVNADTLETLKRFEGRVLIALAVFFGKTRLIDNIVIPQHDSRKIKS
ncbi:MAG: pantoate--beta-alanine ligase [Candidatus Omnitrophica bacterium]|nr:pantoate--beta-alanine ligase [Candidatus Omnitrophota bacterium]